MFLMRIPWTLGQLLHTVNRSFPYVTPGWSVEVRDGEYRASKLTVDGHNSTQGKEGWLRREGQLPGPSVTITRLTQVGAVIWFGIDRKMTIMDPDGSRMCRASPFWGALLRRQPEETTQGRNPPHGRCQHRHKHGANRQDRRPSPTDPAESCRRQWWNPAYRKRGGGGGGVMSTGWEDVMKISASYEDTASFGRGGGVLSGTGERRGQATWMEDHVQRNRRKQSDESCRAPLIQSRGGGSRFRVVAEVHRPPSTDD